MHLRRKGKNFILLDYVMLSLLIKINLLLKELELQLAVMIATIGELAVEAGVSVPSIEDLYVISGPNMQISRKLRWEAFEKWYIGNELHENLLKSMPTVARIMFTDWEKKHVKDDTKLREVVLQRQSEYNTPQPTTATATNSIKKQTKNSVGIPPQKPIKRMATNDLALTVTKSATDEDEIVKLYEIEVNKAGGDIFRCSILKKQVNSVLRSRNLSMMRLFWPPAGTSRPTSQYIFPRLGLITPKYEEPTKRFKPFPSRSSEMYSIEEVMAWYLPEKLLNDDELMIRNEAEGQKHQAYLNWLAEEEERMERGRLLMVEEDIMSSKLRIHAKSIEIDREIPQGKPRYKDFMFGNKLPGQYEDIGTKTVKFIGGSGMDNEDEVQDILEKMAKETEQSLQHAKELKKKKIEDRKRKEEEDRIKQEKLERDQRIEENKDRLKKIRENLENIKLQRKLAEEEKQRELIETEKRNKREQMIQSELLKYQQQVIQENKQIEQDNLLMKIEDDYHHYCREKKYNQENMEREDELGFLLRDTEKKKKIAAEKKLQELKELYEEFVPFQFDSKKIRNKKFHYSDDNNTFDNYNNGDDDDELTDENLRDIMNHNNNNNNNASSSFQLNWKSFQKQSIHDLNDLSYIRDKTLNSPHDHPPPVPITTNLHPNSLSKSLFSKKNIKSSLPIESNSNDPENNNNIKKIWPRSENLSDIVPSLIWSGPDPNLTQKYSKLKKKSRPFTPMNPGENMYNNPADPMEPQEILLSHTSLINPLETIGLSKSLIKSINNNTSTFSDSRNNLSTPFTSANSGQKLPKLNSRQISSPLNTTNINSNVHTKSETLPISPHLTSQVKDNQLQHKLSESNLQDKSRKKSKNADQFIERIKSDRESLRAFISSASSSVLDDKFYLEACRPGLRSRDSINSNEIIQNYRQTLLKSYENKPTYNGSAIVSAVKESFEVIKIYITCYC